MLSINNLFEVNRKRKIQGCLYHIQICCSQNQRKKSFLRVDLVNFTASAAQNKKIQNLKI